jgi:hypothetical protein
MLWNADISLQLEEFWRSAMVRYILLAVCFAVGSCGSENEVTTASPYDKEQLRNLEIRAAGDDLVALRELELHYGFEGNMVEVKKIQQRRLSLRDPEALGEEVMRIVMSADKLTDCASKKTQLNVSMKIAVDVAMAYKVKNVENDADVKLVQRELDKLQC